MKNLLKIWRNDLFQNVKLTEEVQEDATKVMDSLFREQSDWGMATSASTKRLQFAPKAVSPPIKQQQDETLELASVQSDFVSILTQRHVVQVIVNQASTIRQSRPITLPQDPAEEIRGLPGLFEMSAYYAHPTPWRKDPSPQEPDCGNTKREPIGREDSDHSRSMVLKNFIPHTVMQLFTGRMGPDESVEWLEVFRIFLKLAGGPVMTSL